MYYSVYSKNRDTKPAYSIIDLFIKTIRENYSVKKYIEDEERILMEIVFGNDKKIVLGISDKKRLGYLLLMYIANINDYYIRVLNKKMDVTMDDIFKSLFVRLTQNDAFEFNVYLEDVIQKTCEYSNKLNDKIKKM